jgi:hypothetical protein
MRIFGWIALAGLLATVVPVAGQTPMISSGSDLLNFMNSDLNYITNQRDRYASIEGSPYLEEEFREGALYFRQQKYVGLQLRYNAYDGVFEFQTDQGVKYFNPNSTPVDTVWVGTDTYLFTLYLEGKARKKAFMKLLNRSRTRVLEFQEVLLQEATEAKGYEEARPARFDPRPGITYVQREGEPAREFRGKKDLGTLFPAYAEDLANYAKKEKLKLKTPEDLVRLCAYFDSLE